MGLLSAIFGFDTQNLANEQTHVYFKVLADEHRENREEVYLEQQMDCNGSVDCCVCAGSLCTSATW